MVTYTQLFCYVKIGLDLAVVAFIMIGKPTTAVSLGISGVNAIALGHIAEAVSIFCRAFPPTSTGITIDYRTSGVAQFLSDV